MEPTFERADGARSLRGHGEEESSERRLWAAAVVSVSILIVEIVGGILANSLALLSDAGHVFFDIFSIGLAIYAARICVLPATATSSFGMHRAEVLAALANGITLIALAMLIFYEAVQRLMSPQAVRGMEMLVVAIIGLGANLVGLVLLHKHQHGDLNVRGAYLHILGDTGSSIAVIVGGGLIMLTGYTRIDPGLSVFIGILIIAGAYNLIKEAMDILLERTPADIDVLEVQKRIEQIKGVSAMHDLHIWSLCTNVRALNAHIVLKPGARDGSDEVARELRHLLSDRFNISHTTVQFEDEQCCDTHLH
jgi:cobalt-zinc-cadmium efflux system protein